MKQDQDDPLSRLIFRWHAPEGALWRLLWWGTVAAVVLSLWLLCFQVVYPAASRRSHTTQHITLLDTSSAEARQAMAAVADRNFLLLTPNATGAPRLSELRPVFSPGFKDFQLQVKDLPESGASPSVLPRLFGPGRSLLPPMAAAHAPAAPAPVRRQRLEAVAGGGLEGRAILHHMEQLSEKSPALGEIHAQMRVAVAPDGRLLAAVSLMDESTIVNAAISREFRLAINSLRFAPVATNGPQWGTLAFRWQEVAP